MTICQVAIVQSVMAQETPPAPNAGMSDNELIGYFLGYSVGQNMGQSGFKAEDMKPPQYGNVGDIYAEPLVENALGGQSAKDTYNIPQPLESNGSPSLPPWLSYIEESRESESYGSPQAEVLTYPGEYKYIPEQSLDSFETFVSFPQVLDDDEPNIPQVPSSDTPDQTNPEQYLNNEPGAVNNVLNNPLDYSEAVTNFMEKMRAERILVLDLTRRV